MPNGPPSDVRLGHTLNFNRSLDARENPFLLQSVLKRKRINDGGQHSDIIRGHPFHAFAGCLKTTENVAAANHAGKLNAKLFDFLDLFGNRTGYLEVNTGTLASLKGFAGQFQDNPFEHRFLFFRHLRPARERRFTFLTGFTPLETIMYYILSSASFPSP